MTPPNNSDIEIGGITKTAADWSRERFGDAKTVTKRLFKGWDPREAVLAPKGMTREAWRSRNSS